MPFLARMRSATVGRALTRRPFADRVGNRRVTDDFVGRQVWGAPRPTHRRQEGAEIPHPFSGENGKKFFSATHFPTNCLGWSVSPRRKSRLARDFRNFLTFYPILGRFLAV